MASGTTTVNILSRQPYGSFQIHAADFLTINSNWSAASVVPAGLAADTNDASVLVRLFDDTVDEGIGLDIYVPVGATDIRFTLVHRAETSPSGAKTVGIDFFTITDTGAWSGTPDVGAVANLPNATEAWQYESYELALSATSLVTGEVGQVQINCDVSASDLVGDWVVRAILFEFF